MLRELVSRTNVYMNAAGAAALDVPVVERIARWVGAMLRMFGLGEGESAELGWGQEAAAGNANVSTSPVCALDSRLTRACSARRS